MLLTQITLYCFHPASNTAPVLHSRRKGGKAASLFLPESIHKRSAAVPVLNETFPGILFHRLSHAFLLLCTEAWPPILAPGLRNLSSTSAVPRLKKVKSVEELPQSAILFLFQREARSFFFSFPLSFAGELKIHLEHT